jgi:hypothetical protein
MDDQSPSLQQTPPAPQPGGQANAKWFPGDRLVAVFLVCIVLGFVGTLTGFIPLIAIAMIGPVAAAALA